MLTLLEKQKISQDELYRAVIDIFAKTSPVLERIQWLDIKADTYRFNREESLPTPQFRGINESYTENSGKLDLQSESLSILGTCVDVDRVLEKTSNIISARAIQTQLQSKAIARRFDKQFIKGDTTSDPRSFDGLQARLDNISGQILDAGTSSGGDTLTLALLDEALDLVDGGANAIICNKTMRRKINSLIRATGSAMETVSDSFGRQLLSYASVPILVMDKDDQGSDILDFDETAYTGSSVCTSIYCVRFDLDGLAGLQNGDPEIIDHGLYSGGNAYRTVIEWLVSIVLLNPRAASRLRYLKNA